MGINVDFTSARLAKLSCSCELDISAYVLFSSSYYNGPGYGGSSGSRKENQKYRYRRKIIARLSGQKAS